MPKVNKLVSFQEDPYICLQTSNISRTLAGKKIVDH